MTSTERGHLSLNLPLLLFEFLSFFSVREEKRKVDPGGRGKLSSIDISRTRFFLLLIVAFKFLPHFESIKSIRREGSLRIASGPVTRRRDTDRKRACYFLLLIVSTESLLHFESKREAFQVEIANLGKEEASNDHTSIFELQSSSSRFLFISVYLIG